jgi:hypothetical protein
MRYLTKKRLAAPVMYTIPLSSSADDRIKTISCTSSSEKTSVAFNAKSSVIDALAATGNDDTDIGGKENLVKMPLVIGE